MSRLMEGENGGSGEMEWGEREIGSGLKQIEGIEVEKEN